MPISRTSLREQVRDELLHRIGSGALAPGDRIVEAAIAEDLGVSSVPVREAIRELVTMGILEAGHHKGSWVREVSIPETIQALQVRAALESLAARLAAPAIAGHIAAMRQAVRRIIDAAQARDFVAFQEANQAFHGEIVEASGNKILRRQWDSLAFDVRTRAIMDYIATADPVEIAREHEAIAEAFAAGEAERAAALLAAHSAHLVEYLRQTMALEARPREANAVVEGQREAVPSNAG